MQNRASNTTTFTVFEVCGQKYAVPITAVARITPMAKLHCPPGAPNLLAGFVNLAGDQLPVIRIHSLFNLEETPVGLWTPLIVLRGTDQPLVLLVDRVDDIVSVQDDAIQSLAPNHVFNDCVEGVLRHSANSVLILSPERLLLEKERQAVEEFQNMAQQRIGELAGVEA